MVDKIPGLNGNTLSKSIERPEKIAAKEAKTRDLKLQKAARDFESIFIAQVIKAMEKTVPKSDLQGSANTLPSMLFSTTIGKAVADQGGVGLAEMIYRALKARDPVNKLDNPLLEITSPLDILNNVEGMALGQDD